MLYLLKVPHDYIFDPLWILNWASDCPEDCVSDDNEEHGERAHALDTAKRSGVVCVTECTEALPVGQHREAHEETALCNAQRNVD